VSASLLLAVNPLSHGLFFDDWRLLHMAFYVLADLYLLAVIGLGLWHARSGWRACFVGSVILAGLFIPVMLALEILIYIGDQVVRPMTGIPVERVIENVNQPHERLVWAPIPNAVGRAFVAGEFDVQYFFDDRGRKRIAQNPATGKTLHVFGASYIFGHGIANADTALNLLAERTNHRFNVQNYGVSGYGLEQMVLRMEDNFDQIRDGDLVYFIPTASSLARNTIHRKHRCKGRFLRNRGDRVIPFYEDGEWRRVSLRDECRFLTDLVLRNSELIFGRIYDRYFTWSIQEELDRYTDTVLNLARSLAEARGAAFRLLFMARPGECRDGKHDTDWSGLTFPHETLLDYCPADLSVLDGFSFPIEWHLTVAGNRWAADALEKHFRQLEP